MKIIQLTPGTGSFHCGNCVRDNALVSALRKQGHDCMMVPMYLPMVTDGIDGTKENSTQIKVQFGGINAYLQQHIPLLRHTPSFIDKILDSIFNHPGLLRWSSKFAGMTKARELGDMSVSMLKGRDGNQRKEIDKLCKQLKQLQAIDGQKVEMVHLSNCLLSGLAGPLRKELNTKIFCTLMAEEGWIDTLPEPQRSEVWRSIADNAKHVDYFIAVSQHYADTMVKRLSLEPSKVKVIHNGIDLNGFLKPSDNANDKPPTLGYFARLIPAKGLHHLVDAFIELKKGGKHTDLKLKVGGAKTKAEEKYVREQIDALEKAGLKADYSFVFNLTRDEKMQFLNQIDLLCVPVTYEESFGTYAAEAWAAGVPTLLPATGAFPELNRITNGGLLFDDHADMTSKLSQLMKDSDMRSRMSAEALNTSDYFSHDRMASELTELMKTSGQH